MMSSSSTVTKETSILRNALLKKDSREVESIRSEKGKGLFESQEDQNKSGNGENRKFFFSEVKLPRNDGSLSLGIAENVGRIEEFPTYVENTDQMGSLVEIPGSSKSPDPKVGGGMDLVDAGLEEISDQLPSQDSQEKKRKGDPDGLKTKKMRNLRREYCSSRNCFMYVRCLKPTCSEKCKFQCSLKFSQEERQEILNKFWQLGSIDEQRKFIMRHIKEIARQPNQRKNLEKVRGLNLEYYFRKKHREIRVCKVFFLATLDTNGTVVRTARQKVTPTGFVQPDKRGKHGKQQRVDGAIKKDIKDHLALIPKIENHHLREKVPTKFIEEKQIADIYQDYVYKCIQAGKPCGNLSLFLRIFHENLMFFSPLKDPCGLCTQYLEANVTEREAISESYRFHKQEVEICSQEENNEKKVTSKAIVCVFDRQAVLPTPNGDVPSFYYKSKLATYNFTIFNLKTKESICHVWNENEADIGANEIASCVYFFIKETAEQRASETIEFVFYTDNCAGPKENKVLSAMYMYSLYKFRNITHITHKLLVAGHPNIAADTVHSVINYQIKRAKKAGPIYVPVQYIQLMRSAKKFSPLYQVKEFIFDDFIDFESLTRGLGELFTADNRQFNFDDVKVLKINRYEPYMFHYKTTYLQSTFKMINIFSEYKIFPEIPIEAFRREMNAWKEKPAYHKPTGISREKLRALMSLVNGGHIPKTYHLFYKSLTVKTPEDKPTNICN